MKKLSYDSDSDEVRINFCDGKEKRTTLNGLNPPLIIYIFLFMPNIISCIPYVKIRLKWFDTFKPFLEKGLSGSQSGSEVVRKRVREYKQKKLTFDKKRQII
jgi:hypothetical protein